MSRNLGAPNVGTRLASEYFYSAVRVLTDFYNFSGYFYNSKTKTVCLSLRERLLKKENYLFTPIIK